MVGKNYGAEPNGPSRRKLRRLPYVAWTAAFLSAAYLLLRLVIFTTGGPQVQFPDPWQFLDPLGMLFSEGPQQWWALAIHVALATALVLFGVARARDVGWKPWIGLCMAVPVVRLFIFTALAVAPSDVDKPGAPRGRSRLLDRLLPKSRIGSAVASTMIAVLFCLPMVLLNVRWLEEYGLALFIGIPFLIGAISAFLYGYRQERTLRESIGVAALALSLSLAVVFIVAVEGIVCILMAMPVAYPVAIAGALIGHALSQEPRRHAPTMSAMLLVLPGLMAIEKVLPPALPSYHVTTKVSVHADARTIWNSMIAFSRIDEPLAPVFKAGISYPTEARIEGRGVGAVRYCQFNTGPFVEPITAWEEPHRLAFDVREQPPPLVELSIYNHIDAPHIQGFFLSQRGEIQIIDEGNGNCMLVGTTWYTHDIFPSWYWNAWSASILHLIHFRVLDHIKAQSERNTNALSVHPPALPL